MNISIVIKAIKKLIKTISSDRRTNEVLSTSIENSVIQQAENLTINYDSSTLKLQQEIVELRKELFNMPKIYSGTGDPPNGLRDGDIYIKY